MVCGEADLLPGRGASQGGKEPAAALLEMVLRHETVFEQKIMKNLILLSLSAMTTNTC